MSDDPREPDPRDPVFARRIPLTLTQITLGAGESGDQKKQNDRNGRKRGVERHSPTQTLEA
jgi:hypothetical protein